MSDTQALLLHAQEQINLLGGKIQKLVSLHSMLDQLRKTSIADLENEYQKLVEQLRLQAAQIKKSIEDAHREKCKMVVTAVQALQEESSKWELSSLAVRKALATGQESLVSSSLDGLLKRAQVPSVVDLNSVLQSSFCLHFIPTEYELAPASSVLGYLRLSNFDPNVYDVKIPESGLVREDEEFCIQVQADYLENTDVNNVVKFAQTQFTFILKPRDLDESVVLEPLRHTVHACSGGSITLKVVMRLHVQGSYALHILCCGADVHSSPFSLTCLSRHLTDSVLYPPNSHSLNESASHPAVFNVPTHPTPPIQSLSFPGPNDKCVEESYNIKQELIESCQPPEAVPESSCGSDDLQKMVDDAISKVKPIKRASTSASDLCLNNSHSELSAGQLKSPEVTEQAQEPIPIVNFPDNYSKDAVLNGQIASKSDEQIELTRPDVQDEQSSGNNASAQNQDRAQSAARVEAARPPLNLLKLLKPFIRNPIAPGEREPFSVKRKVDKQEKVVVKEEPASPISSMEYSRIEHNNDGAGDNGQEEYVNRIIKGLEGMSVSHSTPQRGNDVSMRELNFYENVEPMFEPTRYCQNPQEHIFRDISGCESDYSALNMSLASGDFPINSSIPKCPGNTSTPRNPLNRSRSKSDSIQFVSTISGMCCPQGIVLLQCGTLVVCDMNNHRVKLFNGELFDRMVKELPSCGGYRFHRPSAVIRDFDDNFYVKDDKQIFKFSRDGNLIVIFGLKMLSRPYGMVLSNDTITIIDEAHSGPRLVHFSTAGESLGSKPLGIERDEQSKLRFATSLEDRIYISDLGQNLVYIVSNKGDKIGSFGSSGKGECQFKQPAGLTADHHGDLLVADSCNYRIQLFSPSGSFKRVLRLPQSICRPSAIFCSGDGYLFISNYRLNVIKVFKLSY